MGDWKKDKFGREYKQERGRLSLVYKSKSNADNAGKYFYSKTQLLQDKKELEKELNEIIKELNARGVKTEKNLLKLEAYEMIKENINSNVKDYGSLVSVKKLIAKVSSMPKDLLIYMLKSNEVDDSILYVIRDLTEPEAKSRAGTFYFTNNDLIHKLTTELIDNFKYLTHNQKVRLISLLEDYKELTEWEMIAIMESFLELIAEIKEEKKNNKSK